MKDILDKISVDIVLPNYNSYPFIEETIKSIISQTFKNWKLFIVDGNSNIETQEILRKYDNHPNSLGTEKIANFLYKKLGILTK